MKKQLPIYAADRQSNNRRAKLTKIKREQRRLDRMLDIRIITGSAVLTAAMISMLLTG